MLIHSQVPEPLDFPAQHDPVAPGVSQYPPLSIAVIAIIGIEAFPTGYVAGKSNISDANYSKALWAAVLKNTILSG